MKKSLMTLVSAFALSSTLQADVVFSENFNSYTNGPLLGQGTPPWTITGTSVVNPVSVVDGEVGLTTTGQDVNGAFPTAYTGTDLTSLYYGVTINVSAAQATGDYFLHLGLVNNSSAFYGRVFALGTNGGFILGYQETSGTGSAVNYGTTVLPLNTDHRVTVSYDFVPGPLNDTAKVYVNPDSETEAANAPYLVDTWTTATAETNTFSTLNLRQGTAANAPTLTVDDILVGTTFAEVAQVPEPGVFAMLGIGGLAIYLHRRARRK